MSRVDNGAESLVRTAVGAGVELCFANPGTTEMPLVAALDAVPGLRSVLCLFEGVCAAAADGYARMRGRPALNLLHLGPGLANAVANLHNARRAHSPVLNVVGDHATWHRAAAPPLASDIGSLARPVSGWLRSCEAAERLAGDTADAVAAALGGCVATLVVPHDVQLGPAAAAPAAPRPPAPRAVPDDARVQSVAALLRGGGPCALLLGADGLGERGLRAAGRVAAATGCRLLCDTFPARVERGPGLPVVERLPYFPEPARETLAGLRAIAFAGTRPPVSFFGYPGLPGALVPAACAQATLAPREQDVAAALEVLADALGAREAAAVRAARPARPSGPITPESLAACVAALQPEGAIVVDEGLTAAAAYFEAAAGAPRHSYLALTGGAIGQGLPSATGAALACPDRRVVSIQADGSGFYTLQALWTQAREALDVTTVLLSNRGYRILGAELARAGVERPGRTAASMIDFGDAAPDWTRLARGLGVPAVRVGDAEALWKELDRCLGEPGPQLVEAMIASG